jgi:hypothetical protein
MVVILIQLREKDFERKNKENPTVFAHSFYHFGGPNQ